MAVFDFLHILKLLKIVTKFRIMSLFQIASFLCSSMKFMHLYRLLFYDMCLYLQDENLG